MGEHHLHQPREKKKKCAPLSTQKSTESVVKKINRYTRKPATTSNELSTEDWERLNKDFFGKDNMDWGIDHGEKRDPFEDDDGDPRELDFE